MGKINILTYADGHYLQHVCVMLMSLKDVVSKSRDYHVHVFHANCDNDKLLKFNNTLKNYFPLNITYELQECHFGLGAKIRAKKAYMTSSIYDKILIYSNLPSETEKVVFFDADIVLFKDPALLFDINIDNYIVAAVKDQVFEDMTDLAQKTIGVMKDEYFNTGVMVVNLLKWRSLNIAQKSLDFAIEKWDLTPFHDQDAFNHTINGQWLEISPLWNPRIDNLIIDKDGSMQNYKKMEVYENNLSYLVHYSGPEKPWFYMAFHPKKQTYLKYLRMSEFRDYKFPDFNFSNFVKKQILKIRRKIYFIRKRRQF